MQPQQHTVGEVDELNDDDDDDDQVHEEMHI